jgi:hypothetical protein
MAVADQTHATQKAPDVSSQMNVDRPTEAEASDWIDSRMTRDFWKDN